LESSHVKAAHKMLVKLTPGVDLTNILLAAFTCKDPKSAKRKSSHQCLLAILGSLHEKVARKMLVKSTLGEKLRAVF